MAESVKRAELEAALLSVYQCDSCSLVYGVFILRDEDSDPTSCPHCHAEGGQEFLGMAYATFETWEGAE